MTDSKFDAQGLPPGYNFRPGWEISPRQVKTLLEGGGDVVLLDCRTPAEFHAAHIEGSVLLPLQQVASRIDDLEEHKDHKIVVFCHHGMRSLQMTSILRSQGFKDVTSMAGGIDLWSMDVDKNVPRY